ncbi:hypothetical protein GGR56DRAFT_595719 [Xylariaceae sp. FL0804]|nr:hypothetical protein GGR56DRAFT_595719 [Xylariaceae sp. FL0804]
MTAGSMWWYGFHMPRVHARDRYYSKLEGERAERQRQLKQKAAEQAAERATREKEDAE